VLRHERVRRLLPNVIRRSSAKYGYDPAAMVGDLFTMGLKRPVVAAHARGPLAEAARHYDPRDVVSRLLQQAPPERVGMVNTLRYVDLKLTLAGDVLVKVDRACMSVALEVRPVYLHRDMLQLAAAIPAARLAGPTHTKEAVKIAAERWLPARNIRRRKQGFLAPLGRWLREGNAGGWTRSAGSALHELLDTSLIEGPRPIHQILMLDHWMARWKPMG
jgi:asparagine synthetase B (glutamine-hydrolysing)